MLWEAEKSLIGRERAVRGLETLLDPEAFRAALESAIGGPGILGAERTYVRYKPGANCLVAYRLDTERGMLEVYAKAHGADARVKLAKARERRTVSTPLGPGCVLLDDLSIAVWIFPNEGKLAALADLVTCEARPGLLSSVLPEQPSVAGSELRRLRYKPERRYVARMEMDGAPWGVLKLYTRRGYADARRRALAFRDGEILRVPRLLGKWSHPAVVVTAWMPGQLLSEALRDPAFRVSGGEAVGVALAELHQREPVEPIPLRRPNAEISNLFSLAHTLGHLLPDLASLGWALARRLASFLDADTAARRPVHGDFYAKQVLLDGERVVLLDLDGATRAAPASDLGVFIAHLERNVLRGTLPGRLVEPATRALLEGYRSAGAPPGAVDAYTALALFRLAHDPFRHCEPDWPERTEALLVRTEQILARTGEAPGVASRAADPGPRRGRVIPVADRFGVDSDPAMPFLAEALEPRSAQRELASWIFKGQAFELRAIEVGRYRPGRRCVIRYDLEGPSRDGGGASLIGKVRAKGLDETTYRVSGALRRAGLGADHGVGVSVPDPLGVIPPWRMWLQARVPGVPATQLLPEPGGVELARRIAEGIHALHEAGVSCPRRHTLSDEVRILHQRLPAVAQSQPQWQEKLARILEACDRLAQATPACPPSGIHRDFYSDHVLVDGDRLHIIDLDLYCEGDRALDVGNFSAHLIELGLRLGGDPHQLDREREAFEERFLELAGEELRPAIETYRTLTLVRHIHISTLLVKRHRLTEPLLELSEQALFGVSSG